MDSICKSKKRGYGHIIPKILFCGSDEIRTRGTVTRTAV